MRRVPDREAELLEYFVSAAAEYSPSRYRPLMSVGVKELCLDGILLPDVGWR
jgi:hypothetical protein